MTTAAVRAELGATGRPIVLSIGRLHAQKGFDVLLDAAASWHDRDAPLLVIAGDGPDRARLAERANAQHVEVRWLGYVEDRARIAELLGAADLVVFASRWEGSPLAVHEALMAGRPVVATAVGGLTTLLRAGEVRFVPPADAAALASAISRLLDHPAEAAALAAAGREASKRWPDANVTAAAVLGVYADVLQL
jgi:glycosyltransferase involved in cell wall biosynthesis